MTTATKPARATVRVLTPGAYRVEYTFTERKGSRNVKRTDAVYATDTTPDGARVIATTRRGHLTAFAIVSVEQDYETRPMTRDEEHAAAQAAFARVLADRAAKAAP